MSIYETGTALPSGTRVWPAASGETGVAFVTEGVMWGVSQGYWRVARFALKHAPATWRFVGVPAPEPPPGAPSELCRFSGGHLVDGLESTVQRLSVSGDWPRRRDLWEEACADVRMGWDGEEP